LLFKKVLSRIERLKHVADERNRLLTYTTITSVVLAVITILLTQVNRVVVPQVGAETISDIAPPSVLITSIVILMACWVVSLTFYLCCWDRTMSEASTLLNEGPLKPILTVTLILAAWGIVGTVVVDSPTFVVRTLVQMPFAGSERWDVNVPVESDEAGYLAKVDVRIGMMSNFVIKTDQDIAFSFRPHSELRVGVEAPVVPAGLAMSLTEVDPTVLPGLLPDVDSLSSLESVYLVNQGADTATVEIYAETEVFSTQAMIIPTIAFIMLVALMIYIIQRMLLPRLFAVALSTYKSEVNQPLFPLVATIASLALIGFVWIPYNTFGEDIKMLKDTGITLITVLTIFVALWAASTSVAEEIEGRTALTVLSKPINRRSFVIGKFFGISWALLLMYVILGVVFLIAVAYKPIFDAREATQPTPPWERCYAEMIQIVPGLALSFMETIVFAALSVAISTRLNLLGNFSICLIVYLLGHLTPLLVESSAAGFDIIQFFGQLIATVFPNLENFNVEAAIAKGIYVPFEYLSWAFLYCLIYSVIAMLLALLMFEDRDLA
jgi:ABC-type transport system involved in multi-copper enzyme maturation permease subunit